MRWIAAFLFLVAGIVQAAIPEDDLEQIYELSPTARVSIRNRDGRIVVYGAVAPRIEVYAMRRAFTKERLEAIQVSVKIEGETAVIDTVYPPAPEASLFADRSGTVDYLILVPQTCTLESVTLEKGEVVISGMRSGGVTASLGRGVLQVANCFGETRLSLGQGQMRVRYDWWEAGALSLSASSSEGDIRVALPRDAGLRFEAEAANGSIHNEFENATAESEVRKLEKDFGAGGPIFQLRAENGDIWLQPVD